MKAKKTRAVAGGGFPAAVRVSLSALFPRRIGADPCGLEPAEETWVRRLFEKAVGGLYRAVLPTSDWVARQGSGLGWNAGRTTDWIGAILPSMKTDIILDHRASGRVVIYTQFNAVLFAERYREATLRSGYIYQMYAYVRSQERMDDPASLAAAGLLLHPSIGLDVDKGAEIDGHILRFATVDLTRRVVEFRAQLLRFANPSGLWPGAAIQPVRDVQLPLAAHDPAQRTSASA